MNKRKIFSISTLLGAVFLLSFAITKFSTQGIPAVYHNIFKSDSSSFFLGKNKQILPLNNPKAKWRLVDFENIEYGAKDGILLKFKKNFAGTVIYGLYPKEKMLHPNAVFFKKHVTIKNGEALLDIRNNLAGKYDLDDWEKTNKGTLRYRVFDDKNNIITNKRIVFTVNKSSFSVQPGITAGPFISAMTDHGFKITFWTNEKVEASLTIGGKKYQSMGKRHIIIVDGLQAGNKYDYSIDLGVDKLHSYVLMAPTAKAGQKFSFAFASDSRGGTQLGLSEAGGHNAYIMRKMMALADYKNVDFFQFTGDMVDGYNTDIEQARLEYTNWLRTMSPFMKSIPFNVGMGNHEAFLNSYGDPKKYISVDKFPFKTQSAEALFSEFFQNPANGPISEDGNKYDPNPNKQDFPPYDKTVYSYTYGNLAMIVLNSNYWYTPNHKLIPQIGGNAHGYVMDQQLKWLSKELAKYDNDKNIKHIFVSIHTPAFPNGGHSHNDMWYKGNNAVRPYIAGKPVDNGIIQQRDIFLDLLVNKTKKFRALLTGDEHNYTRLSVDAKTPIYPKNWKGKRLILKRPFLQFVDGAAGAPYYAEESLPWSKGLKKFSAQYALMIFHVDGEHIKVEVLNPDTLETIDEFVLI